MIDVEVGSEPISGQVHVGEGERWSSNEMALRWVTARMLAAQVSCAAPRRPGTSRTGRRLKQATTDKPSPLRPHCHRLTA